MRRHLGEREREREREGEERLCSRGCVWTTKKRKVIAEACLKS